MPSSAENSDAASMQGEGGQVDLDVHDDRCLLALQGPKAAEVLQPLLGSSLDLGKFYFSNFKRLDIGGIPAWLTRTGYAGVALTWAVCTDVWQQGERVGRSVALAG